MEISTDKFYSECGDDKLCNSINAIYRKAPRSTKNYKHVVEFTIQNKDEELSVVLTPDQFRKLMRELKYIEGVL